MVTNNKHFLVGFTLFLTIATQVYGRSIHRPKDPLEPSITVSCPNQPTATSYTLKSSHFEEYPIFTIFDQQEFEQHYLPTTAIPFRNEATKSVEGAHLSLLIDKLMQEIYQKKKFFTHFTVITRKNFNRRKACGLIILKFKDYPFVLKLFIETPKTFINPYCKGLDNIWFFMLSGINRHITGLTRIKNLDMVKEQLSNIPEWSFVDTPRKWYWAPKEKPMLQITGANIGNKKSLTTKIPAVYGIIADEIKIDKKLTLFHHQNYRNTAMQFCNHLNLCLDPHIDNFMIEKGTKKLVLVDTEHFTTFVGLKKKVTFSSYFSWYRYLANKCANSWFFRSKRARQYAQFEPNELALA